MHGGIFHPSKFGLRASCAFNLKVRVFGQEIGQTWRDGGIKHRKQEDWAASMPLIDICAGEAWILSGVFDGRVQRGLNPGTPQELIHFVGRKGKSIEVAGVIEGVPAGVFHKGQVCAEAKAFPDPNRLQVLRLLFGGGGLLGCVCD